MREVHRRTFAKDVASNPLPTPLTDVAFSHAATLLPVTKVVLLYRLFISTIIVPYIRFILLFSVVLCFISSYHSSLHV